MNYLANLYDTLIGEGLSANDLVAIGLDSLFVDAARLVVEKQDYRSLVFQKDILRWL